ncbi:hypothetical protein D3C83_170890 [compost metagenome]
MAIGQGRRFSEMEISRIKQLLADTDMTISEIATRMHCSNSSIASINRRHAIRNYNGKRAHWETGISPDTQAVGM